MARRKGELSRFGIDQGWPHQVSLPEHATTGKNLDRVHAFCKDKNLSLCPLGHLFVRDGKYWKAWCFAEAEHAEAFQKEFGGEFMTPKTRPRWPG
ncbi:hypothetical protein [Hyphomicrobium sp. MC8b]|uniref:hypothetical protein n=1 Tax=Hyphomicrobium sp. MC8b TaxID=300273 RepID=UPI00391CF8B2